MSTALNPTDPPCLSGRDLIYFGSTLTHVAPTAGEVLRFNVGEWVEGQVWTCEASQRQGFLAGVPPHVSAQHGNIAQAVVPGMPVPDIIRVRDVANDPWALATDGPCDPQAVAWTWQAQPLSFFASPVIKVPASHPNRLPGVTVVASGARSALLKLPDGTWLRLKGCGNHEDGFTVRANKARRPGAQAASATAAAADPNYWDQWLDIRGAAFPQTTLRELWCSYHLGGDRHPGCAVQCANASVGSFRYTAPDCLPLGAAPDFQTMCIVERTLGDRRLGTHLATGLMLLLPLLIDEAASVDTAALAAAFPAKRPRDASGGVEDTAHLVADFAMATAHAGPPSAAADAPPRAHGLHWTDLPRDGTLFVDATAFDFKTLVRERLPPGYPPPLQWAAKGPVALSATWQALWDADVQALGRAAATAPVAAVLPFLFRMLGVEAGRTLRHLHVGCRTAWGTYQDQMCRKDWDEWHCNAHANNFVVLPEAAEAAAGGGASGDGSSARCRLSRNIFLAFLDLDMAFGEANFDAPDAPADAAAGAPASAPPADTARGFEALMWREYVDMMATLAMGDVSTGVPAFAEAELRRHSPFLHTVSSALRDTLVLGYQEAYGNATVPEDTMEVAADTVRAAHCLVRLALIATAQCIA